MRMMALPLLALTGAATSEAAAQLLSLRAVAPADPLAVCLDGVTRPHYYSVAPRAPAAADHWQIILFGPQNGWATCFPPPKRDKKRKNSGLTYPVWSATSSAASADRGCF